MDTDLFAVVRPGAGDVTFPPGRYCDNTVFMAKQTVLTRKRRGPPPTGKGTLVGVRLLRSILNPLDTYISTRPEPTPSRPEMIRKILEDRLTHEGLIEPGEGGERQREHDGIVNTAVDAS